MRFDNPYDEQEALHAERARNAGHPLAPLNIGTQFVVCAWCTPRHVIGRQPCAASMDGTVSHGICEVALSRELGSFPPSLKAPGLGAQGTPSAIGSSSTVS